MNDHSSKIFNYVRERVTEQYPKCFCTTASVASKDVKLPALKMSFSFPSEDETTRDSSGIEKWTRTVCDAEAYSGTSEQEARAIVAVADEAMARCGFRRSNYAVVPNADQSVRRIAVKWRAKLDASGDVAPW